MRGRYVVLMVMIAFTAFCYVYAFGTEEADKRLFSESSFFTEAHEPMIAQYKLFGHIGLIATGIYGVILFLIR